MPLVPADLTELVGLVVDLIAQLDRLRAIVEGLLEGHQSSDGPEEDSDTNEADLLYSAAAALLGLNVPSPAGSPSGNQDYL